jgi:hypothetical protein
MTRQENEALAKRVSHFYERIGGSENQLALKLTTKHFKEEGITRQRINGIIKRYKERGTADYLKIPGRPSKRSVESVKKQIDKEPGISVRNGALKTKMPYSTYQFIKRKKLGVRAYVKQTVPKYAGNQVARAQKACRALYRKTKVFVMDDETYVPIDPTQVPCKEYFHAVDKKSVPDNIHFKSKQKFAKRYLVWQALDQMGNVSEPYVSNGSINGQVYLEECLKKRLLPFIEKHHKKSDVIFWPDMATAHYHNDVTKWLKAQNVEFVKRDSNAPNCPQVRPIERFWAECKKIYKSRRKQPKTLTGFKRIWKNISETIAERSGKNLMRGLKTKLKAVGHGGVLAPYKL